MNQGITLLEAFVLLKQLKKKINKRSENKPEKTGSKVVMT